MLWVWNFSEVPFSHVCNVQRFTFDIEIVEVGKFVQRIMAKSGSNSTVKQRDFGGKKVEVL